MAIHPRVNALPSELIEAYRRIEPATIGHVLHFGFLDYRIRPLLRPVKFAGSAFTVRTPAMDTTMLHRCFEMLEPGDVLMLDRSGDLTHAGFGGTTAFAAKMRGVAAVVVDGLATDIQEIEEIGVPVFARGLTNLTTKAWGTGGDINVPVTVGGVVVRPGDLVVGDDNGVMVLPPEEAPALLALAQEAEARSRAVREQLALGGSLTELSGAKNLIAANTPALLRKIRFP